MPAARLFYSFHPADDPGQNGPLFVVFNGGPGAATTSILLPLTGPVALNPSTGLPEVNPHSWTSMGHVLYVDSMTTGFSYELEQRPQELDAYGEAADVLIAAIRFARRHRQLDGAPMVWVGESYGGIRATIIARIVVDALTGTAIYDDELVDGAIEEYLTATGTSSERLLSRQRQVLLQTWAGNTAHIPNPDECVAEHDPYQCDEPQGYSDQIRGSLAGAMMSLPVLESILGIDPRTIAWMYASERVLAQPRQDPGLDPSELTAVFGQLAPGDRYYTPNEPTTVSAAAFEEPLEPLVGALGRVPTFASFAWRDTICRGEVLQESLATSAEIESVVYDEHPRQGVERPGWLHVTTQSTDTSIEIRFPLYSKAGHFIPLRQPGELRADLEAWLSTPD